MGRVQGAAKGYETGPAAVVGGVPTAPRRITNHYFAGPDYSVLHPGIFPHNAEAAALADLRAWLEFDVEAGWGTDEFEDSVPADYPFPEVWRAIDDRYDARELIEEQRKRLDWAAGQRLEVLRNAFELGEIEVERATSRDLRFSVPVRNIMRGHSAPTGFDAERVMWLEVTVTDAEGQVVFRSGDLDPNGDVRDSHSLYVHAGKLPLDSQLFSLQSRFLTRMIRGGEREQVLTVNYSQDPLPFIRPSTSSTILTGQPAGARKHRFVMPPMSERVARYKVPRKKLTGAMPYTIDVRFKSGMVPVNLIHEIQGVGFDFNMSPRAIADAVVAGHQIIAERRIYAGAAGLAAR